MSNKICNTKNYGLTKGIYYSLGIYVYSLGKERTKRDEVEIFNKWSEACNFKSEGLEQIIIILDHIRSLKNMSTEELERALKADNFIHLIPPEE